MESYQVVILLSVISGGKAADAPVPRPSSSLLGLTAAQRKGFNYEVTP